MLPGQRVHGCSLQVLYETDAVADRDQNDFHARIGGDQVVEGTDRKDVLVVCAIAGDAAALQRVIQQDQASWPQAGQHLFVVLGVASLVGVDEGEVELLAGRQCAQRIQTRTDAELDPVGDPGFLPWVMTDDLAPSAADVRVRDGSRGCRWKDQWCRRWASSPSWGAMAERSTT